MPLVGAFIVPHPPLAVPQVGRGQEKAIQKTIDAYHEFAQRVDTLKPDVIVLTSPHVVLYADYFHISPGERAKGDFRSFGAGEVVVQAEYDCDFVHRLAELVHKENIPAGILGERDKKLDHGTMVPLYFVNQVYNAYKLVRIGLSGLSPLDHYHFGKCIGQVAHKSDKRVIFVASGDLSHKLKEDGPYGFAREGPEFDLKVTKAMAEGDFLRFLTFEEDFCEAAAECGRRSFILMAGALDGIHVIPELISYEGPFGVGYAVASFAVIGQDDERHFDRLYEKQEQMRLSQQKANEDEYVRLARSSLEYFIRTKDRINRPEGLPKEMTEQRAGVFVSLKKDGMLRGCIGTISPTTKCIADEIIRMAVSAATEDPRFAPVLENELDKLVYSVDVLSLPEPVKSMEELDTKRYGVIVRSRGRLGLLLPNLEGIDTPKQQVSIALEKGGISMDEHYSMERFKVVRHT